MAAQQKPAEPPKKSFRKAFLLSAGGIIGAALTASLTAWLTGVPSEVSDLISSSASSPVLISVRHLPGQSDGCGYWLVDKSPRDLTPMTDDSDSALENWIHNNDVADTRDTELVVTVQGQTSRPVVLTDLQFVVVHRNYGAIPGH
jgi:hypothetical protein